MPAAAVIPAPVAYIKVVAVKKLVVGFLTDRRGPLPFRECAPCCVRHPCRTKCLPFIWPDTVICIDYFEKIRVFKAGLCSEYISME